VVSNERRFYPGQHCLIARLNPAPNRWGKPKPKYLTDRIQGISPDGIIWTRCYGPFRVADLTDTEGDYRLIRPDHVTDCPRPGWYAEQWRQLKALPDDDPRTIRPWWNWAGESVAECKQKTRKALHQRINARGGHCGYAWKKFTDDNLWAAWKRDQRAIRENVAWRRVIRSFETEECRQRFGNLITHDWED
jgi:hypothetical protein